MNEIINDEQFYLTWKKILHVDVKVSLKILICHNSGVPELLFKQKSAGTFWLSDTNKTAYKLKNGTAIH